jgi:hypothetical protein
MRHNVLGRSEGWILGAPGADCNAESEDVFPVQPAPGAPRMAGAALPPDLADLREAPGHPQGPRAWA